MVRFTEKLQHTDTKVTKKTERMTPERWQQVDKLFHAALKCEPGRRAAFLTQSCAGDEPLHVEIESLIASHEQAQDFIEMPASDVAAELLARNQSTLEVGQTIGHYNILSSLGAGGMGEIYLADDTQLGRQIALKLLPAKFTIDSEHVRRFEQEARAVSALNHPNIVTIHEIGRSNSLHFIATEFIDGENLRQRLANSPVKLEEALDIAVQVASALSAAHAAGIVHRDIKPENIMLRRDGFVKVLDFGLAKLTLLQEAGGKTSSSSMWMVNTNPGMVMGTVQYMSPEQARGQDVDARTDIWSLGVVLYEMITSQAPFLGETPSHVLVSILEGEPAKLAQKTKVPPELEEIVEKALRKKREQRYQTANELAIDLKSLKQDLGVKARLKQSNKSGADAKETTFATAVETDYEYGAGTTRDTSAGSKSSAEYLVAEIKRHKRGATIAAAALIMIFTTLAYSFYWKRGGGHLPSISDPIDSVAVLPFVNEGGDPSTEYLADGISDSVINSLSRLPKLRVIGLNAVLRYKGKPTDPQRVGRDLNIRAVLMGRMMQRGDDLTISTELVDVRDNRRLWGEQYNRKRSDILAVQEEIARKISEGLRLQLTGEERKQLEKRYTQDPEAYGLYSLGRYYSEKNTKEGWEKSVEFYEEAIKIDQKYALAYVGLSRVHHQLQMMGFEMPKETLRKREWAALKAVEVDNTLSEAHAALAEVKAFQLDWTGAERESKRALELDPNSFDANRRYATNLAHDGRLDEALVYAKRVYELEPTKPAPASFLGYVYFLGRQYDKAIEYYLKSVERSPDNASWHFFLGEAYVAKGMHKEGIDELQKAVALDNAPERWDRYPVLAYAYAASGQRDAALKILAEQKRLAKQRYIPAYNFAIIYLGLGDLDQAFEYLNKSFDEGKPLIQVPSRPLFDILRSDRRYTELLRRINRL